MPVVNKGAAVTTIELTKSGNVILEQIDRAGKNNRLFLSLNDAEELADEIRAIVDHCDLQAAQDLRLVSPKD